MPGLDASSAITIGGITCWDEGTRERIKPYASTATRVMLCAWEDRYNLINAVSPGATSVGGIYIFGTTPYPANPSLYPQEFTIDGIGSLSQDSNEMVAYQWARITFEYSTFKGGDSEGYLELDVGTNVIAIPRSGITLETVNSDGNDPLPVLPQDANGIPVVVLPFTRGMRNVANFPINTVKAIAQAPINSTAFAGYDPGTVIFDGGRAIRQTATNIGTGVDPTGGLYSGIWDIELRFIARPALQWDYLARYKDFNDDKGPVWDGFAKARFAQGKGPFMGRSDLNQLFQRNVLPSPVTA